MEACVRRGRMVGQGAMSKLRHTANHAWPLSSFLNKNNTRHRETGPLFVWCDRCQRVFLADKYWVYKLTDWLFRQRFGWPEDKVSEIRDKLLRRVATYHDQPIRVISRQLAPTDPPRLDVRWTIGPLPRFIPSENLRTVINVGALTVSVAVMLLICVWLS